MIAKASASAIAIFVTLLSVGMVCAAQGEEVVAVITELKFNKGDIQIGRLYYNRSITGQRFKFSKMLRR
jgi:hypothetical protein